FIHITAICYLPAALATMPLVQAATQARAWAKIALAFTVGMMLVTGTFGGLVGGFGGALTDVFGSRTLTAQVMKIGMVTFGSLMIAIALGEFGFIRKLLPDPHLELASSNRVGDGSSSGYRRAAITGATIAATFGIICTRPTYVALLLYIAVVGSTLYGIAVLGAYGIGLAIPIVFGGRLAAVSSHSAKLAGWLRTRMEGLRVAQGVLFALLGAMVLSYFSFRYVVPPG
ncbi:MAG: cytochrome c biogenesis protein CcdA, partial [Chloroflexota bacterium]